MYIHVNIFKIYTVCVYIYIYINIHSTHTYIMQAKTFILDVFDSTNKNIRWNLN